MSEARPVKLTTDELTALRWSRSCNNQGIGFLGPTVWRKGPLPQYASAVESGLLRCIEPWDAPGARRAEDCGYWLTEAGRAALNSKEGA